jgi:hypothetical protein
MGLFHRHRWKEVRRYAVPPRVVGKANLEGSIDFLRRTIEGLTVIELRCEECGDVTHRELPGTSP